MKQMSCAGGYKPGRTVAGLDAVRERAAHIVRTPPGALPQDPEWGWGIAELVGRGLAPGDLRTAEALGRDAFRRDPELREAAVKITPSADGSARVDVRLTSTAGTADLALEAP